MSTFKTELSIAFIVTLVFCGFLFAFVALSDVIDIPYGETETLAPGELAPNEVAVTIPEGFVLKEIEERFKDAGIDLKTDDKDEGYLFPDTYRFYLDATSEDVIKRMKDTFLKKVGNINKDDLILASIVQREVAGAEDMKIVAGIFKKRLVKGIALQADSTVNYVTGKSNPRSLIKDTKIDSPYNTYKYPGLPPGPISNPGLSAILAVKNPETSPYLYFLTTPDNKVIYSKNFEEHKQARFKYLD
jgi:UPF0755 protein